MLESALDVRRTGSTCVTQDALTPTVPSGLVQLVTEIARAVGADDALEMPSSFACPGALALDGRVAGLADVRAVRGQARHSGGGIEGLLGLLDGFEVAQIVEELVQSDVVPPFALELESALQADADQKLQVVRQSGDQREQLLCDSKFPDSGLLGLGEQGEECHNLLAEKFGLARVGHAFDFHCQPNL